MALADLLRRIHRLQDLSGLCRHLGYTPDWCELTDSEARGPGPTAIVGRQGEFAWYAVDAARHDSARRVARALAARGVAGAVLGLDRHLRCLTIAALKAPALELALDEPHRLDLARLTRCAARGPDSAFGTVIRIAEALDGRPVDERFFLGFRQHLDQITATLPTQIALPERHALALLQLTRILFLYFVEAKGWLAGRPRFLREEVDRCLWSRRSLHKDLLQPLFFGTLNRPLPDRGALARRFGAVPFLNGGLFEPHPLERRWRVTIPTPVVREVFDSLFERFHFTLTTDECEAIAPDMLGRVFERVMEPGERHATGSYYTPAALVDAVVRDALATWLSHRHERPWPLARRQVDEPDASTRQAFSTVTLLDPAVGSGAFLLGALRILTGPPGAGPRRAPRLRQVVSTSLFGVDRNPAAVRLAELRLWLEVVAADSSQRPDGVAPLPNLDALIRQGDSLVDPAAGLPLRSPSPPQSARLRELRARVVESAGPAKRPAAAALAHAERDIAREALDGAVRATEMSIAELLDLAHTPSLFGERRGLRAEERSRLRVLRDGRRRARERLRAVHRSGEVPWFHYPTHFADIFAKGGFDLVLGNPPWVRAETLAPEQRRYLAERYAWFRGARANGRGYAHQPDLSVAFLERGLELVAPRGVVAFLVPVKLATTGYATAARAELVRRTSIALAADLRGDPRAGFDATVYPMAFVAALTAPAPGHRIRLSLGADEGTVPQQSLGAGPWALLPRAARETLERLRAGTPALGQRFTCHLGVKTGLNQVFLDPPPEVEPELVRWAVRGRDVRAFAVRPTRHLLWPCDERGQPLEVLPPEAARHLGRHSGALRRRADHAGGKPWSLFRTGAASAPFRVVWPDLARRLTAAPLLGRRGLGMIPLNSCYVIPTRSAATALRLAAWLNSTWCRGWAAATADPASGGFARFNARVVSALPCPAVLPRDGPMLELGRAAAAGRLSQEDLDARCAALLGLTPGERTALAELAHARAEPGR